MKSEATKQLEYGKALATLYIAAQEGVSLEASNTACDLIENASSIAKFGFNQVMRTSQYNVRAIP